MFEEERILSGALDRLLSLHYPDDVEIMLVAGGRDGTIQLAKSYARKNRTIRVIVESPRRGKPWALNKILSSARGEVIVLTDADVVIDPQAIPKLIAPFRDPRIGAACGRVIALNDRTSLYGFWAHFLCEAAHDIRTHGQRRREFFHLTGYLYAIRKEVVERISEDSLADDAMVGLIIRRRNYETAYVPEATAYVKFPENFKDFLGQKARTRAGFIQLPLNLSQLKELLADEFYFGLLKGLRFCRSLRELLYFLVLSALWRFVWLYALWKLKIKQEALLEIWRPISST